MFTGWIAGVRPAGALLCVGGTNLFIADGLTYVVPVFIRSARVFAMAIELTLFIQLATMSQLTHA